MREKIESLLPTLYRDMHAAGEFHGRGWEEHRPLISEFFVPGTRPILDFGCGPLGGLSADLGDEAIPYDPHLKKFSADPWVLLPRGLFSCDVLEHLTVPMLRDFAGHVLATSSIRRVLLVISTRAANKTMPNGMNAHLTVHPADWWVGFFSATLGCRFGLTILSADHLRQHCVLGFVRRED